MIRSTLLPLVPPGAYFPDFLTPEPSSDGVEAAIDAVISTPTERLGLELGTLGEVGGGLPGWAIDLAAGHGQARRWLGSVLRRYFEVAVRPYWSDLDALVTEDRMVRDAAMIRGGLAATLAGLYPAIRWEPPVLRVRDYPVDRDLMLAGRGLTLIPSYFCWGAPVALADPERTPILVYSAQRGRRGARPIVRANAGDGRGAAALIGATRVALLRAASVSLTTTELAKVVGISPATASHHTAILRGAGLIHSRRSGNMMLHLATPMATRMLQYDGAGPPPVDADPAVVPSGTSH
jgi:DNA-binding transcriptional ArsR family regulator